MQPIEGYSLPRDRIAGAGGVRTRKEWDKTERAHCLDIVKGGASQDNKNKRLSEGDSLPKDHIERHKSGHENRCDKAEGTHFLETTSGGTSKDT